MRHLVLCLLVSTAASGCVHSYKAADYGSVDYVRAAEDDGVSFSYLYDAQPGYYGEKARDRGYSVVAVRVTNGTDAPVSLNRNSLRVLYDGTQIQPVRGETVADVTSQPVWNKLLWGLLNVTFSDGNSSTFIPTGPVIAGGFIYASVSNNTKASRAFRDESLFGLTVAPGETTQGLLFLQGTGRAPLSFDYAPTL